MTGQSAAASHILADIGRHADAIMAAAASNEADGRLQSNIFETLLEIGAIHALAPRALGGFELNASDALRVFEALSEIDASTGWVAMAAGFCTGAAAAYLPQDAIEKILTPTARGVVAGAGAPTGVAKVVSGGFEVTGRWRYGSGILHAQWAHCGVMVERDGANGAPEKRIAYIDLSEVQRHGNWDVIGLRATGSVDFSVERVFVPDQFTVLAEAPTYRRGDPLFRESLTLGTLIGHCGWAMGTSRRLLNELASFARSGGLRSGSLGADPAFHAQFARHEALIGGARAYAYEAWRLAQERINQGHSLTTLELTRIRLALVHVTDVAAEAAYFAFRSAGGESLRQGTLQRLCRDILAGGQHITSSPPILQACGRVLAGLAEDEIWSVNNLVKASPRRD